MTDGHIPAPPDEVRGATVLARLVDGLAFRYRWATEGLTESELAFRPADGAMSTSELLDHVHKLARWVEGTVRRTLDGEPDRMDEREPIADGIGGVRESTLAYLGQLRAQLVEIEDAELAKIEITGTRAKGPQPFWSMINGPLADALTHVGQINTYRRIAGNPAPAADVFRGLPPD
ncbi:MAG: DinB family protein [bacterium]|nr:DinB family protein [bacterium]